MKISLIRKLIKASSMRNMQGNWIKYLIMTILSYVVVGMIVRYLPISIPTTEQFQAAMLSDNYNALFTLLFPEGISQRMMLLIGIVVFTTVLVLAPLQVGICRFFLKVSKGEKPKFSEFLSPFMNLGTVFASIIMWLLITIISAIWSALFMVIPVAVTFLAELLKSPLLAELSLTLLLIATVFTILWVSRYKFLWYIFTEGKSGGVFGSYRAFIRIMRRRTWECFLLRLTYFTWDIASSFFPPISIIYSALMDATYAKYLAQLRGEVVIFSEDEFGSDEE